MQRVPLTPRPNWQHIVEQQGLTFHTLEDGHPYWDESAAYQFTAAEIDTLEAAANELQGMCLAAAQHIIDRRRYADLSIPPAAIPILEAAWNAEPPALYGRFDLIWSGAQPGNRSGPAPKLLEYNADTPTSLLEAAVIQWNWLEEVGPHLPTHSFLPFTSPKPDQFNSLHEKLIAKWRDLDPYLTRPLYFAGIDTPGNPEDTLTLAYLEDTAQQAGLATRRIPMLEIGWNQPRQCFVDQGENQIQSLFKLYPWEILLHEDFGSHALETYARMNWIEPIWKLFLSNKGILPILWELYPNHPLLLEAHFDSPRSMPAYVRKPLLSREGQNVSITYADGTTFETPGTYADSPETRFVFQALAPECIFPGALGHPRHPVLGLWMIDQQCCGMGIRESAGPITDNLSSFIPHFFR